MLFRSDLTIPFTLPNVEEQLPWQRLLDTFEVEASEVELAARTAYDLRPCSMAVFRVGIEEG